MVVVGPGVMGLLVAEFARATGAGRVIVVGRGARLAKAQSLGHETVDFTAGDPVEAVRAMTGGFGAEVALECSGDPDALGQCCELLRKGGRVAVIGIPMEGAKLPLQRVVLDEIDVVGVRAAAGEMPEAIALVAAGRIRLRELITHRFALEDFRVGLRDLHRAPRRGAEGDRHAMTVAVRSGLGLLAALFVASLALRPQLVGVGPLLPEVEADLGVSHAVAGLLEHDPGRLHGGVRAGRRAADGVGEPADRNRDVRLRRRGVRPRARGRAGGRRSCSPSRCRSAWGWRWRARCCRWP